MLGRVEVTHVSPVAFGADGLWAGGERYPLELALAMSELVSTRLVVFGAGPKRERRGRLEICQLPIRGRWKQGPVNPLSELLPVYLGRTRAVHAHQYHSIVTNMCLLVGALARRPVFCTDHGGASYNYADRFRLGRWLRAFLPVSRFSARFFPELADRTAPPLYGGVDPARFRPAPARAPRERQVVYVGRLLPHKGIDVLLRAVDDRTPVHLYGRAYDPAYRKELGRLASGKLVTFHEDASDAEVAEAYRRSRVTVLPSVHRSSDGRHHPWPELLGLTVLESMACGTPVVATRVGGVPEILEHGQVGYLVEPGDSEDLAARLGELLDPSSRWEAMSANAAELVRTRFTWRHVAERCLREYGEPRGEPSSASV